MRARVPLVPSAWRALQPDAPLDDPIVLQLGGTGARPSGRVLAAHALPLAKATVRVGEESGRPSQPGSRDPGPPPRCPERRALSSRYGLVPLSELVAAKPSTPAASVHHTWV